MMETIAEIKTGRLEKSMIPIEAVIPSDFDFDVDIGIPNKIALVVKHMQAKIVLQVVESMIIGRSLASAGLPSFLDLEMFGAASLGVSRKHLCLTSKNRGLFIEDLGSLNRTSVNGIPLESHTPCRIRHDDQVALGGFILKVEFLFDTIA